MTDNIDDLSDIDDNGLGAFPNMPQQSSSDKDKSESESEDSAPELSLADEDIRRYCLRLKNLDKKFKKISICAILAKQFDPVIVAEEYSDKKVLHYHCYFEDHSLDKTFEQVRDLLKTRFNITEGNKQYCLQLAETDRAKEYTVKDADFVYEGYTEDEMAAICSRSYKKFVRKTFMDDLKLIDNDYLAGPKKENGMIISRGMTDEDYFSRYVTLKAAYNQTPQYKTAVDRLNMLKVRLNGAQMIAAQWSSRYERDQIFDR